MGFGGPVRGLCNESSVGRHRHPVPHLILVDWKGLSTELDSYQEFQRMKGVGCWMTKDWEKRYKWTVLQEQCSPQLGKRRRFFKDCSIRKTDLASCHLGSLKSLTQVQASPFLYIPHPSPCLVPGAERELPEPGLSWRMGENLKLSSEFWWLHRFGNFSFWIKTILMIKIDLKFY